VKTADRLLDAAQDIIQRQGYNAMSFDDVAKMVGIKKPSIVHHFPTKAALGKAVIQRYREMFGQALAGILAQPDQDLRQALEFYFGPFLELDEKGNSICLCGSLAGEFGALPDAIRTEVGLFFVDHQTWLTLILKRGAEEGIFQLSGQPNQHACLILSALQGALIVSRATAAPHYVQQIADLLKKGLVGT